MMAFRDEGRATRSEMKMKRPITILSVLVIAALTIGVAVAERMEQRAQQDRISFGADPIEASAQ